MGSISGWSDRASRRNASDQTLVDEQVHRRVRSAL
jgi:hypothetical protein